MMPLANSAGRLDLEGHHRLEQRRPPPPSAPRAGHGRGLDEAQLGVASRPRASPAGRPGCAPARAGSRSAGRSAPRAPGPPSTGAAARASGTGLAGRPRRRPAPSRLRRRGSTSTSTAPKTSFPPSDALDARRARAAAPHGLAVGDARLAASRRRRGTRSRGGAATTSRCSSPIPEISHCPVSSSSRTWKLGSSWPGARAPGAACRGRRRIAGSTTREITGSGKLERARAGSARRGAHSVSPVPVCLRPVERDDVAGAAPRRAPCARRRACAGCARRAPSCRARVAARCAPGDQRARVDAHERQVAVRRRRAA